MFKLLESLLTGVKRLDDDHRNLISRINSVAEVEKSGDPAALMRSLSDFRAELAKHFQEEEAHLEAMKYPLLRSHAQHHAQTLAALDQLMREVSSGEPREMSVAHICFHELASMVLRRDMQFVNWLADDSKSRQRT